MSTRPPDSPDAWLGQRLGNPERYRLDRRLGSGAVGDVFLAMDLRMGRRVAIKVLKGMFARSPELLARFEREIALSVALESEHIVQVIDYGVTSAGHPFYVMEYLQGQTLRQLLGRKNRLSTEETIAIGVQLCAGLRTAHAGVQLWKNQATEAESVKVIHRDLKPANIFLIATPLGELAKILDFGIAKKLHVSDQTQHTQLTQAFLGTSRYAAPEQLRTAWELDERADIYSLGIILYEMLSGTDPFGMMTQSASRPESWTMAHTFVPPTPLRQQPHCAAISSNLETAIMRCLSKHPDERFASVLELSQQLQTAQAQQIEPPIAPSEPIAPPSTHDLSQDPTIYRPIAQYAQSPMPGQDGTIFQPVHPVEIPSLNQNLKENLKENIEENQPNTSDRNLSYNQTEESLPSSQTSYFQRSNIQPHDVTIAQSATPLKHSSQSDEQIDATLWQASGKAPADETLAQFASPKRSLRNELRRKLGQAETQSHDRSKDGIFAPVRAWLQSSASNYADRARAHAAAEMRHKAYQLLTQFLPIGIGFAFGLASLSGAYFLLRSRGANLPSNQLPSNQLPFNPLRD